VPEVALHYLHPSLELDACVEPGSVYHLPSRTYERHRAEIRRFLSIRKADSCSNLQSKTPQPAIKSIFQPTLSATDGRANRH
jgi:hypothetical protein